MDISVSGAAFRPVYYMGKEGLSAHFPRAREGGPRAGVGSLSIKFSQKGPDAVCLCLCPSLAERSKQHAGRSRTLSAAFEIIILRSALAQQMQFAKSFRAHQTQPASHTHPHTPKTLAITLSLSREMCETESIFMRE